VSWEHASKDRGGAAAGRVSKQEGVHIERSEVIQPGQVSVARHVGGEKQSKHFRETVKRVAMRPEGGYVDPNLTREGRKHMVFA
jgi:hypothetical protein